MKTELRFAVLDVGARYGLHPTWTRLQHLVDFDLFEPDPIESKHLRFLYLKNPGIRTFPLALGAEPGIVRVRQAQHRGLTSQFSSDQTFFTGHRYVDEPLLEDTFLEIQVDRLDAIDDRKRYTFFKIDVEGAEYEVLLGAQQSLANGVLGVRAEVQFHQMFRGSALFGDVDSLMRDSGFELLNFDYRGLGKCASPFVPDQVGGQLLSTDAVWIRPLSRIMDGEFGEVSSTSLRMAIFLLLNGASDLSAYLLSEVKAGGADFASFSEDPLYVFLKNEFALMGKRLSYVPQFDMARFIDFFHNVFDEGYPERHEFWHQVSLIPDMHRDLGLQRN